MKTGILASLMAVSMRLDVLAMRYGLTMDASYPKDPDPKNWRTINHSKVHLSGGKIDGGAGGKFHGKAWTGKVPHEFTPKGEGTQGLNGAGGNDKIDTEKQIRENVENLKREYQKLLKQQSDLGEVWSSGNQKSIDRWNQLDDKAKAVHEKIIAAKVDAAKKGVIFTSGLEKSLDKEDVDAIREKVKNASEDVRVVWNRFEDVMKIDDKNCRKGAYYLPSRRGIYFDIVDDKRDKYSAKPYKTILHELGHLIDHHAGSLMVSSSIISDFELGENLRKEGRAYIQQRKAELQKQAVVEGKPKNSISIRHARESVERELYKIPDKNRREVSDIFSGITKNAINGGYYHYTAYWKREGSLEEEAFAHCFGASIGNPEAVENLKKYFPKSYNAFSKMLHEIAEKGRP